MRISIVSFFSFVFAISVFGQKIIAEVSPNIVVGEQFHLTYTVNSQDVKEFKIGKIPEELEVLIGPKTSYQSSYQLVNGKASSSQTLTYTYVLFASKKGTFVIPSAQIIVGNKRIESNSVKVYVGSNPQSSNTNKGSQGKPIAHGSGTKISGSDLFVKVSANKRSVYEQEPVLLTYKVYTLVDLTQLIGKMPDLKGFHTQELELPQQKNFKVEMFNGRPYRTVTWSQYVMFPQVVGKLDIPSITFSGIVALKNLNVDPFEAFFNGGSGYTEVKHSIKAPGLTLQVVPLPNRPAGFSGGVGKFTLSVGLNKNEVKTNEPIKVSVTVNGTGNLKLIKAPSVNYPKDFDRYDVQTTDKTELTSRGVEGSMVYDYLAVPRNQGKFEIPPVEFIYYDLESNSYKTLKSSKLVLNVSKNPKDDIEVAKSQALSDNDIRDIKIGSSVISDDIFFGSFRYKLVLALFFLLFIGMFFIFKYKNNGTDWYKQKENRANKVAAKRLRTAKKLMSEDNQAGFYDEVLRALWGYIGYKLRIPVEQLSRDNISQKLFDSGIDNEIIKRFIEALDECEFERYAPGDAKGNMNKTFNTVMDAIMQIEDGMKGKKSFGKRIIGLRLYFVIILVLAPLSLFAITKDEADSLYLMKQYKLAVKDYELVLSKGVSSDLYYNLGNAYYKSGNITRAIINYERALLLDPSDDDIKTNLRIANNRIIDKIVPRPKIFFVEWYNSAMNLMNVDGWVDLGFVALGMVIIFFLLYFFSRRIVLRKIGFFGGSIFVVIFVTATIFAYEQNQKLIERNEAIILTPFVLIKKSPSSGGSDLFMLHEGTKVQILDGELMEWKEIRLLDGRKGWIETSNIERI